MKKCLYAFLLLSLLACTKKEANVEGSIEIGADKIASQAYVFQNEEGPISLGYFSFESNGQKLEGLEVTFYTPDAATAQIKIDKSGQYEFLVKIGGTVCDSVGADYIVLLNNNVKLKGNTSKKRENIRFSEVLTPGTYKLTLKTETDCFNPETKEDRNLVFYGAEVILK